VLRLHLRAYLKDPHPSFAWADLSLSPPAIQDLAAKTSSRVALAWTLLHSDGTLPSEAIKDALAQMTESADLAATLDALTPDAGRAINAYLRKPGHGLFFDPAQNHAAWIQPDPLAPSIAASLDHLIDALQRRFPTVVHSDAAAEALETDQDEVDAFHQQIDQGNFEVPDVTATVKIRGSAQKAFAAAVKANYGYRCAITGISSRTFLVASHIVPWSEDQTIRLDPTNGICLSLLVDRAFEHGQLLIDDDLTIRINLDLVGADDALREQLLPYDGHRMRAPAQGAPQPSYLQRRRSLFSPP
jgi:HNH endonuclease